MISFDELPFEMMHMVFLYLPRKDRITCSKVCTHWKEVVNSPGIWKNMVICLDSDLIEHSTTIATKRYNKHFRAMEFCWTYPQWSSRWMQQDLHKFSKRACRYIMFLKEQCVQLNSVKVVDWCNILKFKKINYHLCQFLKSQVHLNKLFLACLRSVDTLTQLEISNCHQKNLSISESGMFMSCFEQLSNLHCLMVDYTTLCGGMPPMMEALISSRNAKLEFLDVTIRKNDRTSTSITERQWKNLNVLCPKLKVALHLKNLCHYEDIYLFFKESIPLITFSMMCENNLNQFRSRQYRRTISLIVKNYCKTLENVHLEMNYNKEILDDLLQLIIQKCTNLKYLDFDGIIKSIDLLREICKIQVDETDFKYINIITKNMNADNHILLKNLYNDFAYKLKERDVDLNVTHIYGKDFVYIYS